MSHPIYALLDVAKFLDEQSVPLPRFVWDYEKQELVAMKSKKSFQYQDQKDPAATKKGSKGLQALRAARGKASKK